MLVESNPKASENFEVKQNVEKTPGVQRVVVPEKQQSGNLQRDEGSRPSAEPAQRAVNEHSSVGATGKGRGSGSESRRIEPGQQVAVEGRNLARVENVLQGSNAKDSDACDVPQGRNVKFYIGDGPEGSERAVVPEEWEMLRIPSGAKLQNSAA